MSESKKNWYVLRAAGGKEKKAKEQEEKESITLADQNLLTDPEEILKRKLKKGETPQV